MSYREPIRKNKLSSNRTPAPNPLQRRRFKMPKPPEPVVRRSPEEQKAFLQQKLEQTAFVGYNGLNVPVKAPATPPPQPVQKQPASGELENNSQQPEVPEFETTSEQEEETIEQKEELSSAAASPNQETPDTEVEGEGVTPPEQEEAENGKQQSQIPDLQAQKERASRLSSNWLKIPVNAPGTKQSPIQKKLSQSGSEPQYQPLLGERTNSVLNGLNQFKVQQFSQPETVQLEESKREVEGKQQSDDGLLGNQSLPDAGIQSSGGAIQPKWIDNKQDNPFQELQGEGESVQAKKLTHNTPEFSENKGLSLQPSEPQEEVQLLQAKKISSNTPEFYENKELFLKYSELKTEEVQPLQAKKIANNNIAKLSENKVQPLQLRNGGVSFQPSDDLVQAKLDVSQPEQADPLTSNLQAGKSESKELIESIVVEVVASLQTDPEDSSGQVRRRLKSLEPANRKAVMAKLQNRISPERWQRLSAVLAEPDYAEGKEAPALLSLEEIAPNEGTVSDTQEQEKKDAGSEFSGAPEASSSVAESPAKPESPNRQTVSEQYSPRAKTKTAADAITGTPSPSVPEAVAGANEVEKPLRKVATQQISQESTTSKQATPEPSGELEGLSDSSSPTKLQNVSPEDAIASSQTTSISSGENHKTPTEEGATAQKTSGEFPTPEGNASVPSPQEQLATTSAQSPEGKSAQLSQGVVASGASQGGQGGTGLAIAQNNLLPSAEIQKPSTNFAGTQIVLEQVTGAALAARQRFSERLTQGTEAIATNVKQQKQSLTAAGNSQAEALRSIFAAAREQVAQLISNAQTQLQTDAATQQAALEQGQAATLTQAETGFTSCQEQAQNLGDTYAERAIETADNAAQQVQSRIEGSAQEARTIGQTKAQVGGSTPEVAQAKAKVANDLAADTTDKITSGTADAMTQLSATGPETANAYRQQGQEAASQLGAGQSQVMTQLTIAKQETANAMQQVVTSGNQALGNLHTQLINQLSSFEQNLQQQLQTQVAQKSQEIEATGQQAIATFQQQGQQAITAGDDQVAQFNNQVAGMEIDPEKAPEATAEVVGQINSGYDNLLATADGAFQQVDSSLTQAGTNVIAAISSMSASISSQVQSFLGQAQGQVSQQTSAISGQLASTVTEANAAGSGMVDQVTTSLDGQLNQLDQSFGQGLEEYRGGLDEQVTTAESQAREPVGDLESRIGEGQGLIDEKARQAESKADKNWLERGIDWVADQFSQFLEMLTDPGFWVGLLVGLALAFAVIAIVGASVLTGGAAIAAIVAGMAVAGALAAGAGTIVSNITEGSFGNLFSGKFNLENWANNLGTNMAIGALFGGGLALAAELGAGILVLSGIAGALTVVTNVATKGWEHWDDHLLANMLLVGILSWAGKYIIPRLTGRGGKGNPPGEEPVRPPIPEDPYTQLGKKYSLKSDAVEMLRSSGTDPAILDRLFSRGVDPDTVSLTADLYGRPGIKILDVLTESGMSTDTAVRVIENAQSMGNLSRLAQLAENGTLTRLLKRGFDADDVVLLFDEIGQPGLEIVDQLMENGVQKNPSLESARIAQSIGKLDVVHRLVMSGNLENPAGLRNFLRQVADEVANGQQGKLVQLEEAAIRSESGRVALEQSTEAEGQADIIDQGTGEALQMKVVTSKDPGKVASNINSAAKQLRGETGENPPAKYSKIADVRLNNPDNPMYELPRSQLLQELIDNGVSRSSLNQVDELRVTNGTGTHTFTPSDFP